MAKRTRNRLLNVLMSTVPHHGIIGLHIIFIVRVAGITAFSLSGATPIPSIIDPQRNISAYVGGLAILKCTVINLGTKTVVWRKADQKDPLTIGTLTYTADQRFQVRNVPYKDQWNLIIKELRHKDSGVYECQISSTDRSIRNQVRLFVKGIQISDTTYVEKGDRIVLSCNATSDDVDWFRKGQKVDTNMEFGITITKQVSVTRQMVTSILEIQHATMADDTDFVCRSSDRKTDNVKVHVLNGTLKEKRVSGEWKLLRNGTRLASRASNTCVPVLGPYQFMTVCLLTIYFLCGT